MNEQELSHVAALVVEKLLAGAKSEKEAKAEEQREHEKELNARLSPEALDLPCFAHVKEERAAERLAVLVKVHALLQTPGRTAEETSSYWYGALDLAATVDAGEEIVERIARSDLPFEKIDLEPTPAEEEPRRVVATTTYDGFVREPAQQEEPTREGELVTTD